MLMDEIINKAAEGLLSNGIIGIVLLFFMYLLYQLIGKLFVVIETNTKAWSDAHEKLDTIADNTKPRRREDFG